MVIKFEHRHRRRRISDGMIIFRCRLKTGSDEWSAWAEALPPLWCKSLYRFRIRKMLEESVAERMIKSKAKYQLGR